MLIVLALVRLRAPLARSSSVSDGCRSTGCSGRWRSSSPWPVRDLHRSPQYARAQRPGRSDGQGRGDDAQHRRPGRRDSRRAQRARGAGTPLFQIDRTPYEFKLCSSMRRLPRPDRRPGSSRPASRRLRPMSTSSPHSGNARSSGGRISESSRPAPERQPVQCRGHGGTGPGPRRTARGREGAPGRRLSLCSHLPDRWREHDGRAAAGRGRGRRDGGSTRRWCGPPPTADVTASTLVVGSRVTPFKSAMAFIPTSERAADPTPRCPASSPASCSASPA